MKRILYAISIGLLVSSCANESGARVGLTSVHAPVPAMLSDDLFVGEAIGHFDRTGTIDIHSVIDPSIKCMGSFRYTAPRVGDGFVRCNDGSEALLSFNGLSTLSGYGYGRTSRGPVSFTFGLTPEQAARFLTLPKGKRLSKEPAGVVLRDA